MKRSYSFFSSPSSSSSKPPKKYDVFLSFHGEDTRNNFTEFLYRALKEKGIHHTFIDNELERGKDISEELLKTIEESSCSIIVLSTKYANSSWCLEELVNILDCKSTMEHIVLPIFFLVEPTHVRNKTGAFGEAFNELKEKMEKEKAQMTEKKRENIEKKLKRWDNALTQVSGISGFALSEGDNQAEFIDKFVLKVSKEYVGSPNIIYEGLFGMYSRMEKLKSHVYKSKSGVEFIGICGMGGIGKTTIARTFYDLESSQFECSSFLEKVKDKGNDLKCFEKQLLSDTLKGECTTGTIRNRLCRKKVLVVIDDVDNMNQLETLAGHPSWFGMGTRIIITTRDKHLLIAHGVEEIYDVEPLGGDEGYQLFTWKAGFKDVVPSDEYEMLSRRVVKYADGLPLALKVMGSSLYKKSVEEWTDQLERLRSNPKKEIIGVLQISFDGLEDKDKNIFLLIVCFFKGNADKDYVTSILKKCDFNPIIGIGNLCDKSLLSTKDNRFLVHDLLKEMGRNILREKSLTNELGREIKVWNVTNVSHVFKHCTAIEEIEAVICFRLSEACPTEETYKNFLDVLSKMKKLKLLSLNGLLSLPIFLQNLSKELLILEWQFYPLKNFPPEFKPTQLIEVDMSNSRKICRLWDNMEPLPNLRSVNLSGCTSLTTIFDDFKLVPNLEVLDLCSCPELSEIDPSITVLKKLYYLNLSDCSSLDNLPPSLNGMESLKFLYLDGCSELWELPEDIGHLKNLEELDIKNTEITELPFSIVLLENLRRLSVDSGIGKNMFNTIFGKGSLPFRLKSLKKLDLSCCNLYAVPEELGCFVSLKKLYLSYNNFVRLPASISRLSKLKLLDLCYCRRLRSLTDLPSSLQLVLANECTSLEIFLDPSQQSNLRCSAFCLGCYKLANRQGGETTVFTSLKRYLQLTNVDPDASEILSIALPGSKLPDWFIHQNEGSSVSVKLDPNWCDSKWMGFALCICFKITESGEYISCNMKLNGQNWEHGDAWIDIYLKLSDHLWLLYLPRHTFFRGEWQNIHCGQIEFSFKGYKDCLQGKMCGVRFVYKQDIQEFNSQQAQNNYPIDLNVPPPS